MHKPFQLVMILGHIIPMSYCFYIIDNGYATCLGSLSIYYDYPTSITITPPLLTSSCDSLLSTIMR